jgi:phosphoglycerol transferase MdoB-like AlkP superfamily enzyme
VAAAETAQPRVLTLAGRELPLSVWSPFAYLWQDLLAALIFYGCDARLRRPRLAWIAYAAAVAYIALNVPVARVLSSPLTWTMLRAARGPLADAVLHYATVPNLVALLVVLMAGAAFPLALGRRHLKLRAPALVLAASLVAIGPYASSRFDTRGFDRNAFGALIATGLPRVRAAAADDDWRASPFPAGTADDLTSLRGAMRGRNVVLVILESTGARHLGVYGGAPDPTPELSELARNAIVFDRAYSVYPESVKGLFATLCSRYPAFDTAPDIYADVPCGSLAASLRGAGYRTALFHSGRFVYLGMRSVIERRGFDVLEDAGAIGGQVESSFGVDDESTVRRALDWVDSLDSRAPFFITYLPAAGHSPYATSKPGPFEATSDFWRYMNAIHESDTALGALVDGLRARRLDANTVFIVFGDHGEAFGEHPGNYAHTLFIHEENVRIPFVIAAPGAIAGTRRVTQVASVVDAAPTILDLLGLPADARHQGGSLLEPAQRVALFYTDYSIGWLGLVDGCWKYVYDLDARRSRLFDVCMDPGETLDRSAGEPARVALYRNRVRSWAAAQKDLVRYRL